MRKDKNTPGAEVEKKSPACPECGCKQVYYRRKSKTWACRRCPAVFSTEK
jgi:ribosomal protein L37AE/L43A